MNKKKLLSKDFKDYMAEHYVAGNQSVPDIAAEFNTYPNAIYRAMRKLGIPRRTRSEAQKVVLSSGKVEHPTEGKELAPETKRKIGEAVYKSNINLSETERDRRSKRKKEIWEAIPEEVRKEYLTKSHKSIRRAAKEGSKFEKFIVAALLAAKYKVQVHHKLAFAESELNVDLYLPFEGIAIEIDGPSHQWPIFGQDALDNQIQRDLTKNNLLIANGYTLIRVQNHKGYTSVSFFEDFIKKFLPFLIKVANQKNNGLFEIDVMDKEFII